MWGDMQASVDRARGAAAAMAGTADLRLSVDVHLAS